MSIISEGNTKKEKESANVAPLVRNCDRIKETRGYVQFYQCTKISESIFLRFSYCLIGLRVECSEEWRGLRYWGQIMYSVSETKRGSLWTALALPVREIRIYFCKPLHRFTSNIAFQVKWRATKTCIDVFNVYVKYTFSIKSLTLY